MQNPIDNLKTHISQLTKSQRQVANYIIENPMDIAFLTLDQLANQVQTSTTTIMRLASSLGYSGYSEFQKGLQQNLRSQASPRTRLEVNLQDQTEDELWSRVVNHQMANIQHTREIINSSTLNKAIQLIINANNIYCTNVRSGMPVSEHIAHGLNRLLGNCKVLPADQIDWVDDLITFNSDDLIIAVSFPRYSNRLLDFINKAKDKGVTIIAITDNYSSPIGKFADLLLPCPSESLSFHNSIVSSIVVADFIISAVASNYPERTRQRLDAINQVLTDMNYHYL